MSKIWFTSDTHFCHDKEFVWKNRGYSSVEKMNIDLINKWNASVEYDDTVYHLGDVMLNNNDEGIKILSRLNGNIHIILGNHDTEKRKMLYESIPMNVVDVLYADLFHVNKHRTFFLSHYPSLVANFDDNKRVWNLSGHTHTTDRFALKQNQVYNVGIDAHDGYPVQLEEIIEDLRKLRSHEI